MALEAAVAILEESGPERLTTRAVAARIGYAVGSLYVVFRDRDDLLLQVNDRTLDELRACLDKALEVEDRDDAAQRLGALGHGYLGFAQRHTARWRLVFEHNPDPAAVPPAMRGKIDAIFDLVVLELSRYAPWLDASAARRAAQCLWASVHGLAMLAITDKLSAGGDGDAAALVDELMDRYLRGVSAAPN